MNHITKALILSVERAEHDIMLSSNYVDANTQLIEGLVKARERGERVHIITTGNAGSQVSRLPYYVAEAHYGRLVQAGCEIYETNNPEHGKMYLFDNKVAAFGSYNVSQVSDKLNAEGLLFSGDATVVSNVRTALEETLENRCHLYVPPPPKPGTFLEWLRFVLRRFFSLFG